MFCMVCNKNEFELTFVPELWCQIWSNGKYKSIEHRAVANDKKARISYASFLFPDDDVEIEPLDHMLNSQSPQQIYKSEISGIF